MLIKQLKSCDFYPRLAYVLGKEGAKKLDSNMCGATAAELSHEFDALQHTRPNLTRRVYHCAISLPIAESLDDSTWRKLGRDYLHEMGFAGHQYVMVRHTDTEHEHVHIVANRVGADGQKANDAWDYYRAQAIAQKLEQHYGLTPSLASWETGRKALTRRQLEKGATTGQRSVQEQLQDEIDQLLPECHSLDEFMAQLAAQEIEAQITYGYDNQAIGISYCKNHVTMSGSSLGKRYTLNSINQQWQAPELGDTTNVELAREQITARLDALTQDHPTLSQLIERLDEERISTHLQFRRTQGKQQIQAIRFNQGQVSFLSQSLGSAYSLEGLQTELGVDYQPDRDHLWFQQWQARRKIAKRQPLEPPTIPAKAMQVILLSSPPETQYSEQMRGATIAHLHHTFTTILQEAHDRGHERLQIITASTPGWEQWGTVTALKLREQQAHGEIDATPKLEIIALTQGIDRKTWSKSQKAQYDRILQAIDRVIPEQMKTDYLNLDSVIISPTNLIDEASRSLLKQATVAGIPVRYLPVERGQKRQQADLER